MRNYWPSDGKSWPVFPRPCALVFPPQANPVLVRELVYTGITRAKRQLLLVARSKVMNAAVKRKTERASGLIERLNPNQLGLF